MDVNFEGTIHQFPDDFTDDDVKKALSALPKSPALVKPASTEEIDPLPINPTTGKPMTFAPQFPVIGYTGEPRASTFVDEAVIPTLSTLLGGTVAGPRAVKLGAEVLTAGGGEAINQLYGITKPSLKSILAAAATPIGGRALYGAGKGALTAISKQVAGRPVIAYRVGGALETVKENETGLFFKEQTPWSLVDVIRENHDRMDQFDSTKIRIWAYQFNPESFKNKIKEFVYKAYQDYNKVY